MQRLDATTAVVLRSDGVQKPAFLGTCFAFRKRTHFLTAAHCVRSLDASQLYVGSPVAAQGHPIRVEKLVPHPNADLALLVVAPAGMNAIQPLHTLATNFGYGTDFAALGFPEDTADDGVLRPTGRYFKGSLQRFWRHHSHMGYTYDAAELSIGAPAGLSGGPVLTAPHAIHVIGLVSENRASTTFLHSVQELQDGGSTFKEKIHTVINYATCVLFRPPENWLDTNVGRELGD